MKTKMITEFVKMDVLPTTSTELLLEKADIINDFITKQDGFVDAELVKALEGNTWYFIYHIENFEKLQSVGAKIRAMKLFDELSPLIEAGSMNVSFFGQCKSW